MARVESFYLFAGSNEWEKNEALRKLKEQLSPEGPSFLDREVIDGKEKTLNSQKIFSDLLTVPFFSRRRLTRGEILRQQGAARALQQKEH